MRSTERHDPPELHSRLITRTPFFYGWVVLAAGMIVSAVTIPGQTVGISVFLDSIIDDLGVSRATVSGLYTVGTAVGALSLTYVGRFLDRVGPRLGTLVIGLAFAGACAFLGSVQTLLMLAIGFVLIRGLGQGSLGLAAVYGVNLWFVRRRGLAIGLSGVGFALAIAVVPRIFESLRQAHGWRTTYFILSAAVAVAIVPLGLLFRSQPERYGLVPDGRLAGQGPEPEVEEPSVLPSRARRSGVFWLFSLGVFTTSGLGTGVMFHHFSILESAGVTRDDAALVFVPFGLAAAAFGIVGGLLVDRFPHRYSLAAAELLLVGILWSATRLSTDPTLWAYGTALGAMQGLVLAVSATVYAHEFGRGHLGEIKGTASTITIGGSALGPLLYGAAYDLMGEYGPALAWSALLPLGVASVALVLPPASIRPD